MLRPCLISICLLVMSCKTTSSGVKGTNDDAVNRYRCWEGAVAQEDVLISFYRAVSFDYLRAKHGVNASLDGKGEFTCGDLRNYVLTRDVFLDLHGLGYNDEKFTIMFSHMRGWAPKAKIIGLDLSFNKLSALKIMAEVASADGVIMYLNLSHNDMSADFVQVFPEARDGLPPFYRNLRMLDVSFNRLQGSVTDSILQSFPNAIYLDLSGNRLSNLTLNSAYPSMKYLDFGRQDSGPRATLDIVHKPAPGSYSLDLVFLGVEGGQVMSTQNSLRAGAINMRTTNPPNSGTPYRMNAFFLDMRGWGRSAQISYDGTPLKKYWNSDCSGEASSVAGGAKCTTQGDMPPAGCNEYAVLKSLRSQLGADANRTYFDASLKPYEAYCS